MNGHKRLVRCSVGEQSYCLDSDWLDSIQVVENLYPSRSSDGSIGWIRRFDEKVPVYRLADQIEGASRTASRLGVIMVLRKDDKLWALLVDKVAAASEVTEERVFPLPAVVGDPVNGKFPSVIVEDEGITLYLSPERVVPSMAAAATKSKQVVQRVVMPSRVRTNIERAVPDVTPERRVGRQIITFAIEGVPKARFAVSAGQAMEIVSDPKMIAVPHAPTFAMGLIAWRSLPVPVVDLAAWLGMDAVDARSNGRLIVVRGTVGSSRRDPGLLAIPGVDDIRKLDLPMAYRPWTEPLSWNDGLSLGVYHAERTMLVVPDLDAILSFEAAASAYRM